MITKQSTAHASVLTSEQILAFARYYIVHNRVLPRLRLASNIKALLAADPPLYSR